MFKRKKKHSQKCQCCGNTACVIMDKGEKRYLCSNCYSLYKSALSAANGADWQSALPSLPVCGQSYRPLR